MCRRGWLQWCFRSADAVDTYDPEKQGGVATKADGVQTLLDGSFVIPHVAPGSYYVIASAPGYISPLGPILIPTGDGQSAGEPIPKRIGKLVPRITVQPNLPVSVNVSLERGAAVSGTVLFDDGSPASGLSVQAYVHWKDQWVPLPSTPFERANHSAVTDDQGNYRISGLPAMQYLLEVELALSKSTFTSDGNGSSGQSQSLVFSLPVYSGSKTRTKDATRFSLKTGEERKGEDIQIPLSKLHTVRGSIIARRDGHVINGGWVTLLHGDDKSEASHAELDKDDDGVFQFSFVPEGDYILRVGNAADYEYVEIPNTPHTRPPTITDRRTLRNYGPADLPLHVEGEISGVTVSVPDLPGQVAQPNQ